METAYVEDIKPPQWSGKAPSKDFLVDREIDIYLKGKEAGRTEILEDLDAIYNGWISSSKDSMVQFFDLMKKKKVNPIKLALKIVEGSRHEGAFLIDFESYLSPEMIEVFSLVPEFEKRHFDENSCELRLLFIPLQKGKEETVHSNLEKSFDLFYGR